MTSELKLLQVTAVKQGFVIHLRSLFFLFVLIIFLEGCSSVKPTLPINAFPVKAGDVGPVASTNVLQQPFTCATARAGMGEPLVDNQEKKGQPVYEQWWFLEFKKGYSQYCGAPMRVVYYYRNVEGRFFQLSQEQIQSRELPEDIAYLTQGNKDKPFVVRFERGVINRFVYGVTGLTGWPILDNSDPSIGGVDRALWNKRLIMFFLGGIGLGHQQSGGLSIKLLGDNAAENRHVISLFNSELLSKGYLLAGSSGMGTDTSYNLPLLGETAVMLKEQVVSEYGRPDKTLGVGGSGGAIQQIYNMKRHPSLLDGMIASHLFPDLLTQIPGVGDCELLEYYFDRSSAKMDPGNDFWRHWSHRGLIEGFNALDGYHSRYSVDGSGIPMMADAYQGSSVCVDGWRGVTPIVFNPQMYLPFIDNHQVWLKNDAEQLSQTHWTHWDDGKTIYGSSEDGFAHRTYDNAGVQYGLRALRSGDISVDMFLDINAKVGGWKAPKDMKREYAPYYPYGALGLGDISFGSFVYGNIKLTSASDFIKGTQNLITLLPDSRVSPAVKYWFGRNDKQSVWSHHNGTADLGDEIAPRTKASLSVVKRVKEAGLIFDGVWNKPSISLLLYLEPQLNIHDARQSFVFRERMRKAKSPLSQFSIWGLMPSGNEKLDEKQLNVMAVKAVTELDLWLSEGRKPQTAEDACWDKEYELVAQEDNKVWQGAGHKESSLREGVCSKAFPIHANPREAAGEPFTTELIACPLKSVDVALDDDTYGKVIFSSQQQDYLKRIFVDGVCDYSG